MNITLAARARRLTVATVVAVATLALAASPVSAQTKVRKDRVGDAPGLVDIRSTKVQNNGTTFAVTVRLTEVIKRRTAVEVGFARRFDDLTDIVVVEAVPISRGRYAVCGAVIDSEGDQHPLRCAAGRATVKTGTRGYFRFVIPQSCLGPLSGRQVTQAASYDKRDLSTGIVGQRSASRLHRNGDAPVETAGEIAFDSTSPISTRRR